MTKCSLINKYDGESVNRVVVNNAEDNGVVHEEEDMVIADDYVFEEEPQVLLRKTSKLSKLRNMCKKETSYETFKSQITTNVFG